MAYMRLTHAGRQPRRAESGAAAAELALVLPVLLTLTFGAVEVGRMMHQHHVLTKAVNDAAHYAARLDDCTQANIDPTLQTMTTNLVKSGNPSGSPYLLTQWSDPSASVVIGSRTFDNAAGTYRGGPTLNIVVVTASVPANSALLTAIGLDQTIRFTVTHEERCIRS